MPRAGLSAAAAAAPAKDRQNLPASFRFSIGRGTGVPVELYHAVLHDPALRDPRGYIIPSDQPDFPTATKFIDTLIKNGVTIERATAAFDVNGKHYPPPVPGW